MSMEVSTAKLNAMAKTLLEQDDDKVITQDELKNFVASNDEELGQLNINANDAINELKDILKDNMEADAQNANTTSNNANGSNDPFAEYNKIKAEIDKYQKQLDEYDIQINTLTKDTQALQKELEAAIKAYDAKEAELISENKLLENTINEINSTQESLESDVAHQQKRAMWNAVNDYDPNKDGDWDSYIQKACEGSVYSPLASKLSELVSSSQVSVKDIQNIASSLTSMGQNVETLSDKVTTNTAKIGNLNALKETTTKALEKAQEDLNNSIMNFVSEAEMNLVTANNINLKEALPDGSPRYIFAKGKQDGQYHIYDMGANGASLARQYGCDGGSLKGSDIVPVGNGYIVGGQLNDVSEGQGEKIFWLTDCGVQSKCACYDTCSPLEFDLEGDGHKLDTSKTTKFDIDGDGKLDNINDSMEAVLVFDKDGDGISGEDGSETFGDNTDLDNKDGKDGYKNGFEALKAMRDKAIKEGVIEDRGDNKLNADDLAKLEKNYGLKIKTGGYNSEAKSLSEIGITEINVSDSKVSDKQRFDEFGNEVQTQEGATFKINGKENSYVDMWHRKYSDDEVKNYDSVKGASSLEFDLDKVEKFAINAKQNVQARTSNILAQSDSNKATSRMTGVKALKDTNAVLNDKFWKNASEPDNFFMKNENKAEEKKEQELEEQKELEEKKKLEEE